MTTPTREQVVPWALSMEWDTEATYSELHKFATLARADLEATIAEKDAAAIRYRNEAVVLIERLKEKDAEIERWRLDCHTFHHEMVKRESAILKQQAHIERLKEVVDELREYCDPSTHGHRCECDPSVGYFCHTCAWVNSPLNMSAKKALAIPSSTEALIQHDAELVERIFKLPGLNLSERQRELIRKGGLIA